MIIEQILVTPMAVFCYLIADERGGTACLIDPAGDFELILQTIEKHNVTVRWIINTHGHWDHTSGNPEMMRLTKSSLLIHEADTGFIQSTSQTKFKEYRNEQITQNQVVLLTDKDQIVFGKCAVNVIHTPGHSPGSICLYQQGNLFTGDTLFTEGYGRTDLPGGSTKQLLNSIENKILSLPGETIIWPGHHYGRKPTSTVKEQRYLFGLKEENDW